MLNVFRDNLKHLKFVLWFVVIGLVLYLGYYFNDGDSSAAPTWAARVDGTPISTTKYAATLQNMTEYYRQLMGERFETLAPQLNLGQQVLQQLVDEQVQLHEARKLGISTTPEEIATYIQNDPRLRDPSTGQFVGKETYTRTIGQRWPGGIADFERSIGEMLTTRKWVTLATESVNVSEVEIEDAYRARAEKTKLDYAIVPAAKQEVATKVTDAEIASWYSSHSSDYQRGEARKLRLVVVDRQAQAAKVQVTDADLQAFYSANSAQFEQPEQRRASHILFRVTDGATPEQKAAARQKAEDALAGARAGNDFAKLARTLSEDTVSAASGGDLGFFGRGAMAPPFEQAVFTTAPGEFTPVVETPFGFHVIRVAEAKPGGTQPFAEVSDGIRRQVEQQKAQELVESEANRIHAQIATAADLDAVARKEGLTVEERVLARGERPGDLGPSPQFLAAVFSQDPGTVSPPVGVTRGIAIVAVGETVPPTLRPLDEVKDRVSADVLNDRKSAAARAAAAAALSRHKTLAAAGTANGWEIHKAVDAAPNQPLPGTGGSTPALERALFGPSVARGDAGTVAVPAGAVVYEITQVERFDPAIFRARKEGIRDELLTRKRSEFLQATMTALRDRYKDRIETNSAILETESR